MTFFWSGGALPISAIHDATTLLLRARYRSRIGCASRRDRAAASSRSKLAMCVATDSGEGGSDMGGEGTGELGLTKSSLRTYFPCPLAPTARSAMCALHSLPGSQWL